MMSVLLPLYLSWAMLEPVGKSHVAVRQVDRILPASFGGHRVLLREHQAHDLTQSDILKEELDVSMVGGKFGRLVELVFGEVIFRNHFHVRIVGIDVNGSTQGHSNRAVTGE